MMIPCWSVHDTIRVYVSTCPIFEQDQDSTTTMLLLLFGWRCVICTCKSASQLATSGLEFTQEKRAGDEIQEAAKVLPL